MSTATPGLRLPFVEPEIFTALTRELGFVPGPPVRPSASTTTTTPSRPRPDALVTPPAVMVRAVPDAPVGEQPVRVPDEPEVDSWSVDEGETADETVSSWRAAVESVEPVAPIAPPAWADEVEQAALVAPAPPAPASAPEPAPAPALTVVPAPAPSGRRLPSMPPIARRDG